MIIRVAQKTRAHRTVPDPAIEHVVGADLERGRIKLFTFVVVEHDGKTGLRVALDRSDYIRRVFDGDRGAFLGDLQEEAAVGILPDATAEEQGDTRVVDPFLVAVPIAV